MKFILGQQKLSLKSSILGIGFAESRTLLTENSQKVEKWIQISHFALLNVTPILSICPALIVSLFTYFVLGDSAFELPLPMW